MPLLITVILLIAYASLYPWHFVARELAGNPLWILAHSWQVALNRRFIADLTVNIILYVPLGLTAQAALKRYWAALAIGASLSACIEMAQLFTPTRVCSAVDLLNNCIGTAIGIAVAASFLRTKRVQSVQPPPLLWVWLIALVFPFFPVTSLAQLRGALISFGSAPLLQPIVLTTAMLTWCVAGKLMRVAGLRHIAFALLLIPLQFLIASRAPVPSDILGAVCGIALSRLPAAYLAPAFLAGLIVRGLAPFHFHAANKFNWVPFAGVLASGEWQNGVRTLLSKLFLYGAAVWLLRKAGLRLISSTAVVVATLACIELVQTRIPGHVPEVTDPLLGCAMGILLRKNGATH